MAYLRSSARLAAGCIVVGMLGACAQPKTMYSWQAYQPQVYSYLKDDVGDYAAQAASLEKNVQDARAADQALPPGFRAHLGMLYLKLGQSDKAVEQLQGEKLAFPEATAFMDFLLRNASGQAAAQGGPASASGQPEPAGAATPAIPATEPAAGAGKAGGA